MRKLLLILGLSMACLGTANAQFYLSGEDPSCLRWYSLESAHYQVIFPKGADSLARTYARSLEQFRQAMGRSLGGMTPGEVTSRKLPVVLHTHYPYSNGSVGWAPSRMDLYTHPEPYGGDPIPWHRQLAAHEPRHQAQLQFGQRGFLSWITGEMWAPVYWQLYLEQAFGEGDAVAAETGLATGTRARTADFLNYYRVALDKGERRSWDRWRYGSFKHTTPDHYALGYVTLAGARSLYGAPQLVREALDLSRKKPWFIGPYNTQAVIGQKAGKPFSQAWEDILDHFAATWQASDRERAPFMPMELVTRKEDYALEYSSLQHTSHGLLALRQSFRDTRELVLVKGLTIERLRAFSSHCSAPIYHQGRDCIFWSETHPHPRWGLDGSSDLYCYNLGNQAQFRLSRGARYYNPQPSPEGDRLAAVEYPVEGGSALLVLDALGGALLQRIPLPGGLQATEVAWLEGTLYFLAITEGGYGLYRLHNGDVEEVLPASGQKILNFGYGEDYLEWVSDRTGVNELYHYFPATGKLLQLTCSQYGATDYTSSEVYLYSIVQTVQGRSIYRTPLTALQPREVAFTDLAAHPVEEALAAQERALGPAPDLQEYVELSAPRRYSKLAHPLRLHSWLPLYVNYDAVKESSMDLSYETASPGLSGYFQNTLGTFSGMLGYGLHKDPDQDGHWRNSLHLKATYSGLYPILEATLDVGDRAARLYVLQQLTDGSRTRRRVSAARQERPLVTGQLRAYVPLKFSSGGILSGVTPQLSYSFSNNSFAQDPAAVQLQRAKGLSGVSTFYQFSAPIGSLSGPLMRLVSGSVRAYVMLPRAESQTYPRWGIGAEAGVGFRPGLTRYYAPNFYAYAYGYLPGLTRLQGLRWSTTYQQKTHGNSLIGDNYANVLPRGFGAEASALVGQNFTWQCRITADYAIPIYVGDLSIPGLAYIRNFLLTPHADYLALPYGYTLVSAGADLSASLGRLLFLPFDASVGVSWSYLGGTLYPYTGADRPWAAELIFSIDF